jgi:hypothetical protein
LTSSAVEVIAPLPSVARVTVIAVPSTATASVWPAAAGSRSATRIRLPAAPAAWAVRVSPASPSPSVRAAVSAPWASGAVPTMPITALLTIWIGRRPSSISTTSTPCRKSVVMP